MSRSSACAIGVWVLLGSGVASAGESARVEIASVEGQPGDRLQVAVTLHLPATSAPIAGVAHDIDFGGAARALVDAGDSEPDCAANPALATAQFSYIPSGCGATTAACTGIHAAVSTADLAPIADGTLLYTCAIATAAVAPGDYALTSANVMASSPASEPVPVLGDSGAVHLAATLPGCFGDCGGNGDVSIDDLINLVKIDLGSAALSTCPSGDADDDGIVDISDLLRSVKSALDGCEAPATACERGASLGLHECIEETVAAQSVCYASTGSACAPNDAEIVGAAGRLEQTVLASCVNDSAVRAVGYGPSFTRQGLARRLQSACRSQAASLAFRTAGGPQGAGIAAKPGASACLTEIFGPASRLVSNVQSLYAQCALASGGSCDPTQIQAQAETLEHHLTDEIATIEARDACTLKSLVAVDASTFADRAAAQGRCLAASVHPHSPVVLDCGPRDTLVDAPRGQYVQVVLDEETYGTRCGDGSPYAFWVRLAPEGEPVDNIVVGMQGGGVCIFDDDCKTVSPDLFEAMSDQPETGGPLSNDPAISPFANWTKVYLPYCTQDVFIGGGTVSEFPNVTVNRFGAVDVRVALRYVRDLVWRELDRTTDGGYQSDQVHALFGGFSAGGFGTLYNYHWVLDDLQWVHTAAYPDASLALDNGQVLGVAGLGVLLITDVPPLGWGSGNYLPPYCFAGNCGVGPVVLGATAARLKAVPEQQIMMLSNQVDDVQQVTTFFASRVDWINAMRQAYCATRNLNGVHYFMPAIPESTHVISARNELYTGRAVGGVIMRDWLDGAFSAPDDVANQVEEGTLVDDIPGVMPFDCPVSP